MHRSLRRAFVQLVSEWTYLRAARNTQILAVKVIFLEITSHSFQDFRADQRAFNVNSRANTYPGWIVPFPDRPKWIGTAPCGRQHRETRMGALGPHRM